MLNFLAAFLAKADLYIVALFRTIIMILSPFALLTREWYKTYSFCWSYH